jgi:cytochrome c-type biogenesis protein CcmH/NrfF
MVNEGKTNEQIYSYVAENYGKNQVAVPRYGFTRRLSYGLPFLLIGFISVIALGFAWNWSTEEDKDEPPSGDDPEQTERKQKIEEIASRDGPLH